MFRKVCVCLALIFFAVPVSAATIYIDPGVATLNRGDAITAAVRIMPDKETGECINVVDAVVTYTDNIQPVDISIGKSIISMWVESPVINKDNRTITFAGGIPNGYCGRVDGDPRLTNVITEIIFRSPGMQVGGSGDGDVRIDFGPETQVLLNDGEGTRAPLTTLGATFVLEKTAGGSGIVDEWRDVVRNDNLPPERFSIELVKDEEGIDFSGRYYIVFNTSDKQTGISHYEIMEEPVLEFAQFKWGGVGVPWVRENSPYVLKDQTLNSIIRVKAIDKAGNEYIATYIPDESQKALSRNALYTYILFAVIGLTLVTSIIFMWLWWRRKGKRKLIEEDEDGTDLIE
ncbi:MAG TPA: hypothetical protein PKD95_03750 [Candidatus Paceibacterota bacterium]|nr:hypothetical protein [Candidatus Paceibacterota bacterium]